MPQKVCQDYFICKIRLYAAVKEKRSMSELSRLVVLVHWTGLYAFMLHCDQNKRLVLVLGFQSLYQRE